MEISGQDLRRIIVRRLEFEGKGDCLYDSTILMRISQLSFKELNHIISHGNVLEWEKEENKKLNNE